jgi:hypothetical protein
LAAEKDTKNANFGPQKNEALRFDATVGGFTKRKAQSAKRKAQSTKRQYIGHLGIG